MIVINWPQDRFTINFCYKGLASNGRPFIVWEQRTRSMTPQAIAAPLAQCYVSSPDATPTARELSDLRQWIRQQWAQIPAPVRFTGADYPLAAAKQRYIHTGDLWVSTAHNDHPYLTWMENAMFRAVHDWHHIISGADDTLLGEIATYYVAKTTAPQGIWWMLCSEIVLQAAACIHFGGFQFQKLVRL